jgi:hypothetical protein
MLKKVEICGVDTAGLPLLTAKENEELMRRLKSGDRQARERFIVGNIRLVLSLVKRLSPPVIRFPGGTVMCIYHWEDHIGPKEERKKKRNLIWGGELNPDFGTAEFVSYCRMVGAEPMICVNMASGTPEESVPKFSGSFLTF